jgi:hypothetical protein
MTTRKDDGRRLIQLTIKPDIYERMREHCSRLDIPMTVWARSLIARELEQANRPSEPPNC